LLFFRSRRPNLTHDSSKSKKFVLIGNFPLARARWWRSAFRTICIDYFANCCYRYLFDVLKVDLETVQRAP